MLLARSHGLRAYHAVQLSAALDIQRDHRQAGLTPITLVSADQVLNDAATEEGLAVEIQLRIPDVAISWRSDSRCLIVKTRPLGDPVFAGSDSRVAEGWDRLGFGLRPCQGFPVRGSISACHAIVAALRPLQTGRAVFPHPALPESSRSKACTGSQP